jgi:hypothetical protein
MKLMHNKPTPEQGLLIFLEQHIKTEKYAK